MLFLTTNNYKGLYVVPITYLNVYPYQSGLGEFFDSKAKGYLTL